MSTSGQHDNLVGKQIGQFTILEEVGRGGMATVYRATQQSINRDVAVKVLPQQFLHDPGFFERFKREVEVIAHLEHPHIVPIFDYGENNGMPYIAMRYLAGGTLRNIIKSGQPQLKDLIRPIQQVASALDHAHLQGIIHRDLKPGNVLRDTSGNAYLTDFGIARVLNSDLTGSAIIGTPAYMSPEQARGETLDARADVYSLGVVLFELITGEEPFKAETPIAMILKHLHERVPYLSEYRADIPADVDKVIAIATEKQASDRYSSAGALAEAFTRAVEGTASTVSIPTNKPATPPAEPAAEPALHDSETVTELPATPAYVPRPGLEPPMGMDGPTVTPASGIASSAIKQADASQQAPTKASPRQRRIPGWVYTFAVSALVLVLGGGFFALQSLNSDVGDTASAPVAQAPTEPAELEAPVSAVAGADEPEEEEAENAADGIDNETLADEPAIAAQTTEVALAEAPPPLEALTDTRDINTRFYAITIPQPWIPPRNANEGRPYFEGNNRQGSAVVHIWQDVNLNALVTVSIADDLPTEDFDEQT
ncbi:MAG: protein kinase, partial [Chloroflexota bacterium]